MSLFARLWRWISASQTDRDLEKRARLAMDYARRRIAEIQA
jgi:hypothetical protein